MQVPKLILKNFAENFFEMKIDIRKNKKITT